MKLLKITLILTVISCLTFSCSSDDSSPSDDNLSKIIGTWKFTSSTTNGEADTDNWICDFEDTYEITESTITNKYYSDPSGENGSNCELEGTFSTAYTLSGDTVTSNGFSQEITTLNATTLTLKDVDGNDVYTETYTKQ